MSFAHVVDNIRGRHRGLLTALWAVMKMTTRMWFNGLARGVGGRLRALILVSIFVVVLVGFTVWSSVATIQNLGSGSIAGAEGTYAALATTCGSVLAVAVVLYVPSRDVMTRTLAVLPVGRRVAVLAAEAQAGVLAFALAGFLLAPLWSPVVVGGAGGPLAGLTLGLLSLLGVTVALAFVRALTIACIRVRVPWIVARTIGGLSTVLMSAVVLVQALPMNGNRPHGPFLLLGHLLGSGTAWQVVQAGMVLACLFAVGVGVLVGLPDPGQMVGGSRHGPSLSPRQRGGLFLLELVQFVRFPQNALLLLFFNGLAAFVALVVIGSGKDDYGLGLMLLTVFGVLGVGAYGPTARHQWIYRVAGRPLGWILPKFCAAGAVWALMVVAHGSWLMIVGSWQVRELLMLVPVLLTEFVAALGIGMLIPATDTTAVSGALAEACSVAVVLAVGTGVQTVLARHTDPISVALLLSVMVVASLATTFVIAVFVASREPVG